jgi:hypothetical protein
VLDARIGDGVIVLSCKDSFIVAGFMGGLKLKIFGASTTLVIFIAMFTPGATGH